MAVTTVYSFTMPAVNPDWDPNTPGSTFLKTPPMYHGPRLVNTRKGVYSKPTSAFDIHSQEYQDLLDSLDLSPEDRAILRTNKRGPIPIWCDDRTSWWKNRNRYNFDGYTQNYTTGKDKMWFTRQGNFHVNTTAAVFTDSPSASWLQTPTDFPFIQRNRYDRSMCGWSATVGFVLPAYYFVDCNSDPIGCSKSWLVIDEYFIQVLGPPDGIGITERPEYDFWQVSDNIPFIGIVSQGFIQRSVAISDEGVANHHYHPYTGELFMLEYPGPIDNGHRSYLQANTAKVSGVLTMTDVLILQGREITSIADPGLAACYDSYMNGSMPCMNIFGSCYPICAF